MVFLIHTELRCMVNHTSDLIWISFYNLNNCDFISHVHSKNVKFCDWYAFAHLKETFNKNGCISVDNRLDSTLRSILNSLVIMICSISLILCSRAIYRAQQLKAVRIISHYTVFTLWVSLYETHYLKKVSNEYNWLRPRKHREYTPGNPHRHKHLNKSQLNNSIN